MKKRRDAFGLAVFEPLDAPLCRGHDGVEGVECVNQNMNARAVGKTRVRWWMIFQEHDNRSHVCDSVRPGIADAARSAITSLSGGSLAGLMLLGSHLTATLGEDAPTHSTRNVSSGFNPRSKVTVWSAPSARFIRPTKASVKSAFVDLKSLSAWRASSSRSTSNSAVARI